MLKNITAKVSSYLSMVKFAHTIFAMPFALLGFFLATTQDGSTLSWRLLFLVLACMFFARNAAMSFNRWADKEFDKLNPRTSNREIPAEIIKPAYALAFSIVNSLLFIASTWFINKLCFTLSPIALVIVLGYSLTKRFTSLSHFVLGLGLALAPIGAYLAVTGQFSITPLLLSIAVLCWVTGFDIIYALQDDDFDKINQLRSLPVAIGRKKALTLSLILHIATSTILLIAGFQNHFHLIYWIGLGVFSLLLFYQHTLVKANDLSKVNLAFFTLNGIASLIFAIFAIADILYFR
ncbi:MAG: UbiA family prenyltransferase [Bacteroidales bacterium]|nr:UbiA family prenyltransferase [Bacteroidales bacterium]